MTILVLLAALMLFLVACGLLMTLHGLIAAGLRPWGKTARRLR